MNTVPLLVDAPLDVLEEVQGRVGRARAQQADQAAAAFGRIALLASQIEALQRIVQFGLRLQVEWRESRKLFRVALRISPSNLGKDTIIS